MAVKGPLRKVVKEFSKLVYTDRDGFEVWMNYELLECGHEIRVRKDCFGEFYSTRRRCSKCRALEKG